MPVTPPPAQSQQQLRFIRENEYNVTPGSGTWQRASSWSINPEPVFDVDLYKAQGEQLPSSSTLDDEFTQGDIEGRLDYEAIGTILTSMFGDPTITIPGGGTLSRQAVWAWNGADVILPASYTLESGLPDAADRIPGFLFNGFGFSGDREGFELAGSGWGQKMTHGVQMSSAVNEVQTVTITGSPTGGTYTLTFKGKTTAPIAYNATAAVVQAALEGLASIQGGGVAVTGGPHPGTPIVVTFRRHLAARDVPMMTAAGSFTGGTVPAVAVAATTAGADNAVGVRPRLVSPLSMSLFMGNSMADLAVANNRLRHVYEMDFGLGERWERTRPINALLDSDYFVERMEQEHQLTLSFALDATQRGLVSKIRNGDLVYFRLESIGPIIEGAIPYSLRLDFATFIQEAAATAELNSLSAREWTMHLARNATANEAFVATVVNTRTEY